MPRSRLLSRWFIGLFALVLVSGLVVALADAGVPVPASVAVGALAVCLAAVVVMGVFGYRNGRTEGQGVVRSIRAGVRSAFRSLFDLL